MFRLRSNRALSKTWAYWLVIMLEKTHSVHLLDDPFVWVRSKKKKLLLTRFSRVFQSDNAILNEQGTRRFRKASPV